MARHPGHTGQPSSSDFHKYTYPSFIPFPYTLKLHLEFFFRGLLDAFRWDSTIRTVLGDAEIRSHVLTSLVLNGLTLLSIYVFQYILFPLATNGKGHSHIGWLYHALWLFPLATISLYFNGTWASVVAKRSYALQFGPRATVPSPPYTGMLTAIATSAYRIVMVVTSFVLTNALPFIPIAGPFTAFVFLCWVNAYYCFEFTWIARGLTLAQRVRYLEERWAYYFAYGLPSATLCAFSPGLASAALFALLLPSYIIMSTTARPVPRHPYFPHVESSGEFRMSEQDSQPTYPSPLIPIRIPVFSVVIAIDNFIVRAVSVGTPSSRTRAILKDSAIDNSGLPGDPDVTANAEEGNASRRVRRTARKLG